MRPAYIVVVAAVGAGISLAAIGVLGAPRSISGLNLAALDKSVKPGDDFFDYAVGGWYATADMRPMRSEIGLEQETSAFLSLGDKSGGERTATTLSDQRLQPDTHSPARFRAIGAVRNIDAWYRAFDVQPSDRYYLQPEKRARIW